MSPTAMRLSRAPTILLLGGLVSVCSLFTPDARQYVRHWVGRWPLALACAYAEIPQMINY